MSKAEWGMKRICPSCGARYYDMRKTPPVCPKCKTVFDPENLMKAKRGRGGDKKAPPKDAAEELIDDLPVTDSDSADEAMEDAEELADEEVEEVEVEIEGNDER